MSLYDLILKRHNLWSLSRLACNPSVPNSFHAKFSILQRMGSKCDYFFPAYFKFCSIFVKINHDTKGTQPILWQPSNEKTSAKHDKAEAASLSSTFTIYCMALNFNQLWILLRNGERSGRMPLGLQYIICVKKNVKKRQYLMRSSC